MDSAKKFCSGSGVALQTPIPLHTMGQERCFSIPRMGVFEMDNTKKYCLGSGVAPPYLCTPWARKGVLEDLGWVCLKWAMPKNSVWVQGRRSEYPYLCTLWARKGVFGYLGWPCLKWTTPKNIVWALGCRPKAGMVGTSMVGVLHVVQRSTCGDGDGCLAPLLSGVIGGVGDVEAPQVEEGRGSDLGCRVELRQGSEADGGAIRLALPCRSHPSLHHAIQSTVVLDLPHPNILCWCSWQ